MSKKLRKGPLFFDDPDDSDTNIDDDVSLRQSSTRGVSHVISNEELLSILQDSDFQENYSDSDYEFKEDEEKDKVTSGVYIVEPDASIRPFVPESHITTNHTTAPLSSAPSSSSSQVPRDQPL